jgi:hypothetical protein
MRGVAMRSGARIAACWVLGGGLTAEPVAPSRPAASKIEPGLEEAVNWKWSVTPTSKEWGMPLAESLATEGPRSPDAPAAGLAELRPETYEVKKGDALIKIGRKFNMTAAQLKQFNNLESDRIIIGQTLRIPSPGELLAMEPPPPEPVAATGKEAGSSADNPDPGLVAEPVSPQQLELQTVLLQVFLDREMFSAGAIDGEGGPMFEKVRRLYLETYPETAEPGRLKAKALAAVKQPYTGYALRAEDFRFIKPRKVAATVPAPSSPPPAKMRKKGSKKANAAPPPVPPVTYEELVAADFLAYASAWEFIAERFHCNETFLRRLNEKIGDPPAVGTVFQVPNVIPFEIEKALDPPLQPAADREKPVTAAVMDLSLLKIFREGKLIAVMPLASARPGLRGRGSWTVLNAIPQPSMATRHEPREAPKAVPVPATGNSARDPSGVEPSPDPGQVLAAGPNNPVGILWIHLAKAKDPEPLPYGLHGTSIPAKMRSQEGIGGLRLANWDIARAVRLMPVGTPLLWTTETNREIPR